MADGFLTRFVGLLMSRPLLLNQGLLIKPCNSVHTVGMRFPIDVIYLSPEMQIIKIVANLPAWRFSYCKGAKYALEVAANSSQRKGVQKGDYLVFT